MDNNLFDVDSDDDDDEIPMDEDTLGEIQQNLEILMGSPFIYSILSSDESTSEPSLINSTPIDNQQLSADQSSSSDQVATSDLHNAELLSEEQLTKILNEFSVEKHSKDLISKAGTGDLLTFLHEHWRMYVPKCFVVSANPLKNLIEHECQRVLLQPLENFLCNNSQEILRDLETADEASQLCGKVFKAGEPSYFCRDCGSDPTCVLCSNCFRRSKHREHRYKMTTSAGGGYCDCGDPEAWKQHPHCELHMPKVEETTHIQQYTEDIDEVYERNTAKLPKDLRDRAVQLFTHLLEYIFDMLNHREKTSAATSGGQLYQDLPDYLKLKGLDNTATSETIETTNDYLTVLYNDEVHSYEQVSSTLKKVLGVDEKKAFDYATVVDKEGRSTIKRGTRQHCLQIKAKIESTMGTVGVGSGHHQPLETKVLHHALMAHQYFAERLLVWLQHICNLNKGLKHVLCRVGVYLNASDSDTAHSLLEKLMLSDCLFWKSARALIHQFFISVYFMDPNWKREFAIIYTKNYKLIWRNYVKNPDDTVSLTDLAVQMFTVISLSKFLITNHNLLQIIMETLIEHSKTNKGKLHFPRNRQRQNSPEFRRAQYILFDLKYCLTQPPDKWSDLLRTRFVDGFKSFIDFVRFMHGMDSVTRLTQHHVEFEPEWETSFNLSIKIQKSINALIDWCSSDRVVYLQCYKYLLNVISQVEQTDPLFQYKYEKVKFNSSSSNFEIIDYQVIRQEVSIHAPLTRLFAALYLNIARFELTFYSIAQELSWTPPLHKVISLIEPSIRALCLVAQCNAGLWRRNGFSLLSQVHFYSNIKCRQEMLDRDILCLQIGASLMSPDEFLLNLLKHFGLMDYFTNELFENREPTAESVIQTTSANGTSVTINKLPDELKTEYLLPLSEDFLDLLIYIISERYENEMSELKSAQERVERECIHQLCLQPQPHSDLVKNIYPDSERYANELESVLERLAVFRPSTGQSTKGVYELKDEYRQYYSPYFYHYGRVDRTKSEEYQMSLRKGENVKFFKTSRLPPLKPLFKTLIHLLDSDVFIRILISVLHRFQTQSPIVTEQQLNKCLHLCSLALYEEQDDFKFQFLDKCNKTEEGEDSKNVMHYLTLICQTKENKEEEEKPSYRLYAQWTLDSMKKLFKLKHKILKEEEEPTTSKEVEKEEEEETASHKQQLEKRKNQIAEKRRCKVLAQLNQMQKNFIKNNQEFYDQTQSQQQQGAGDSKLTEDFKLTTTTAKKRPFKQEEKSNSTVVCIGPYQTSLIKQNNDTSKAPTYHCILCQEDEEIAIPKAPMVLCCYMSSSKVLSKHRQKQKKEEEVENLKNKKSSLYIMDSALSWGISTTSCGHVMHATCWQKYVETVRQAEHRRHMRAQQHSGSAFNIRLNEFLCPLCETLANCVLPLLPCIRRFSCLRKIKEMETKEMEQEVEKKKKEEVPMDSSSSGGDGSFIQLSYEDWIDGLEKTLENSIKKELHDDKDVFIIDSCPLSTISKLMTDAVSKQFRSLFEFDYGLTLANSSLLSSLLTSLENNTPAALSSAVAAAVGSGSSSLSTPSSNDVIILLNKSEKNENLNEIKLNSQTIDILLQFTNVSYTIGLQLALNKEKENKDEEEEDNEENDNDIINTVRMPSSVYANCAYTLQTIEQLLRIENKCLFTQYTLKQKALLSSLVKQSALFALTKNNFETVRTLCIRLLAVVLSYKTTLFQTNTVQLMAVDMFHLLVALCLSMPNLYDQVQLSSVANGGLNDLNVFNLVLKAHCVQILSTKIMNNCWLNQDQLNEFNNRYEEEEEDEEYLNEDEQNVVYEFYKFIFTSINNKNNNNDTTTATEEKSKQHQSARVVLFTLKNALMPFLRCSALFFANLTDLTPSVRVTSDKNEMNNNFNVLLKFLGIFDGLTSVLDTKSNYLKMLCNSWLMKSLEIENIKTLDIVDFPMEPNKFMELPNDYVDLISMSMSSKVCSSRGTSASASSAIDKSAESASILCLICGEMLCSQPFCCQQEIKKKRVGSCTAHAYKCGGTVGLFLRVTECQVLMLHLNINSQDELLVRGCFAPAPYLDNYGETDQGLRRGNPLHLCKTRYGKLYNEWISHSIPEKVSRALQNQSGYVHMDWNQF